jgi:hypothetical protein
MFHVSVPYPVDECMGCFLTSVVLVCSEKGAVGQLVDRCGEFLQGRTNELGPCFELISVYCGQLVVPVTIVKCLK